MNAAARVYEIAVVGEEGTTRVQEPHQPTRLREERVKVPAPQREAREHSQQLLHEQKRGRTDGIRGAVQMVQQLAERLQHSLADAVALLLREERHHDLQSLEDVSRNLLSRSDLGEQTGQRVQVDRVVEVLTKLRTVVHPEDDGEDRLHDAREVVGAEVQRLAHAAEDARVQRLRAQERRLLATTGRLQRAPLEKEGPQQPQHLHVEVDFERMSPEELARVQWDVEALGDYVVGGGASVQSSDVMLLMSLSLVSVMSKGRTASCTTVRMASSVTLKRW